LAISLLFGVLFDILMYLFYLLILFIHLLFTFYIWLNLISARAFLRMLWKS